MKMLSGKASKFDYILYKNKHNHILWNLFPNIVFILTFFYAHPYNETILS